MRLASRVEALERARQADLHEFDSKAFLPGIRAIIDRLESSGIGETQDVATESMRSFSDTIQYLLESGIAGPGPVDESK